MERIYILVIRIQPSVVWERVYIWQITQSNRTCMRPLVDYLIGAKKSSVQLAYGNK